MTDTNTAATAIPMTDTAPSKPTPLPSAARLFLAQIRYQIRLLLSSPRTLVVGVGLPVILLVASKGKNTSPNVAGYAVFGLTITAWNTYGLRLVTARESGVLKRWHATPLPRACYLLASITATTFVAVAAATATILAALIIYGHHLGDGPHTYLTPGRGTAILAIAALAALAWAATATTATALIPTIDAALPTLMLSYFPLIIISGALFTINEPHWLSTLASYLPAQPLVDALTHAAQHAPGRTILPSRDLLVLAGWAAGGLATAIVSFRWEPHRVSRGHARPGAACEQGKPCGSRSRFPLNT